MNKRELIDEIAAKADISKDKARKALDSFNEQITQALSEGDHLVLVGFGTFSVVHRAARKGRNPRTGEPMEIAAATTIKFKPGKHLKERVQ